MRVRTRKGRSASVIVAALALCASLAGGPADAGIYDGVCKLRVVITFTSTTKLKSLNLNAPASPAYSWSISGQDMTPGVGSTTDHCFVPAAVHLGVPGNPFRRTWVGAWAASTSADLFTCELADSWGQWSQDWTDGFPTPFLDGDYLLEGTWGAWALHIRGEWSESIIELTFENPTHAENIHKRCKDSSNGVGSLTLVGTQIHDE